MESCNPLDTDWSECLWSLLWDVALAIHSECIWNLSSPLSDLGCYTDCSLRKSINLHAVLHSWSEYYWENVQASENCFQQYLFHRCSLFTALLPCKPSCLVKAECLLWLHRLQHTSVLPLNTQSFEPLSAGGGSMVTPWLCWDLGFSLAAAYCGLHRKLEQVCHRQLPL